MVAHDSPRQPLPKPRRNVPDALIYEIMDGKPVYRKGYREVVSGRKTLEESTGANTYQSVIVAYCMKIIWSFLDDDRYFVLTGESGVHIDHRNNIVNDVAIYDQMILTPAKISKKYADVPPLLAIEVDSKADISEMTEAGYLYKKTRKLFDFGVQRVLWILTDAQVIMSPHPTASKPLTGTKTWN